MSIDIYWHICQLQHWKEIVEEQFSILVSSGLLSLCNNVYIGFLGNNVYDISFLTNRSSKIKLFAFSSYKEHCERLTLNAMRRQVIKSNRESKIFYLHSKGVTRDTNDNSIKLWREIMQYFLIEHHELCIKFLNECDTIGINVVNLGTLNHRIDDENHCMFYSGNFWWSRSEHIRNLPKIPEEPKNMIPNNFFWLNERWLMCKEGKFVELYYSGRPHFYGITREELFNYKYEWNIRSVKLCPDNCKLIRTFFNI